MSSPAYRVLRSSMGYLPVYSRFSNGRTKCTTEVRKVLGSELALSQELSEANFVVERIREDTIVLKGHVVEQVKQFLKEKGF